MAEPIVLGTTTGPRRHRPPELPTLADLDNVDWAALDSCYDVAGEIPGWIRELYAIEGGAEGDREYLMEQLIGSLIHQGTLYGATAAAVPFLLRAALDLTWPRVEILGSLVVIADHCDVRCWKDAVVAAVIAAEVPRLKSLLNDGDPDVRRLAVRLLAATGERERNAVIGWLEEAYESDSDDQVRADAYSTLAALDSDEARVLRREADAFMASSPYLRVAAAQVAGERTGPPLQAKVAEILAEDGTPDGENDRLPRIGVGDDSRTQSVLVDDADAGPGVARRWLELGHAEMAVWLTTEIARHWRDREDELVPILVDALPLMEAGRLPRVLDAIEWMMPRVSEPFAYCEAVAEYLFCPNVRIATAAGLVLARSDDLRVLEIPTARSSLAVVALAHHEEVMPWIVAALRSNEPTRQMWAELADETLVKLVPEFKRLLRDGTKVAEVANQLIRVHALVTDPEVPGLLLAADDSGGTTGAVAAVAYALLTGDSRNALRVLSDKLAGDDFHDYYLQLAGSLGAAAAPLLPIIEAHHRRPPHRYREGPGEINLVAVIAKLKIDGDIETATERLSEFILTCHHTYAVDEALEALADIGRPPPDVLRPRLRRFAWSPHRVEVSMAVSELPRKDDLIRAAALRLLSITAKPAPSKKGDATWTPASSGT